MSYQVPDNLNADRGRTAVVHTADLPWAPSPVAGVERRFLEREGGEVARATSLVRYAAGSSFPEHSHDKGEEFLVLDGVFSDGDGDFPAGSYVRNPPGSRHAPRTATGCVIFVKLRQMGPDDSAKVRVNAGDRPLEETETPGLRRRVLFTGREEVAIEALDQGTACAARGSDGLEIFVLDGSLDVGGIACEAGTWLRRPPGDDVRMHSPAGCRYWVKRGRSD